VLEGTVISRFGIFGKTASRKLSAFQVILNALAAQALPGARCIAAAAMFQVLFFLALHENLSFTACLMSVP
jgi:hypothetical protein